jgi:hypothetical protein
MGNTPQLAEVFFGFRSLIPRGKPRGRSFYNLRRALAGRSQARVGHDFFEFCLE